MHCVNVSWRDVQFTSHRQLQAAAFNLSTPTFLQLIDKRASLFHCLLLTYCSPGLSAVLGIPLCNPPVFPRRPPNSMSMASEESTNPMAESGVTIHSDSEQYSHEDISTSPPSSSSPPIVLYQPPTLWSLIRGTAINLVLPFVNGMMVGFGELFAHEAAFRLGWSGTRVLLLLSLPLHVAFWRYPFTNMTGVIGIPPIKTATAPNRAGYRGSRQAANATWLT